MITATGNSDPRRGLHSPGGGAGQSRVHAQHVQLCLASQRLRATRALFLTLIFVCLLLRIAPALAQPMAGAAVVPQPSASAPTIALVSHKAVYDVSLVRATQRDGVRGARGTMTYALTDRCEGYTIESQMHLDMGLSNGSDSELEQRYASWEAKDNRSASFRMLVRENGKLKDSYHGTATLDAKGAGTATYIGDQEVSYDLPEGTMLSTNHLAAMLTAAATGEKIFNRPVMDGSFDDGPYRVGGVVGPERRAPEQAGGVSGTGLTAGPTWSLALAYFSLDTNEDTPEYEMVMKVGANGIARHLVQDFGGFTLAFDLVSVEPVAGPPC